MPAFLPRSGPAWWRQLAGLPPLPVLAPAGGLACTGLLVAPKVVGGAPQIGGAVPVRPPAPPGFVQQAASASGVTIRLRGLVDDTTGAAVTAAVVAITVTDATGAVVPNLPATLAPTLGVDAQLHGDYETELLAGALAPGRYTVAAVITDTPSGRPVRQLTISTTVVVGPYYGR